MPDHLTLAKAAREAYEDHPDCAYRLAVDLEFQVVAGILAIRGSELDPRDWLRNFAAFPWRCGPVGWAPYGFVAGAKRIARYVHQRWSYGTKTTGRIGAPRYVTGHSAGGAMAILVSELLAASGFTIHECVVFAAPCTGKRPLKVPTTIYDHGGDPVCKVPPFWQQPVETVELPDMTSGPLQHSMENYVQALAVREDMTRNARRLDDGREQ